MDKFTIPFTIDEWHFIAACLESAAYLFDEQERYGVSMEAENYANFIDMKLKPMRGPRAS